MILPDLNLLLYAYNAHLPQHAAAHQWWTSVIDGDELIGFPYEITFGFVRIATHQRLGFAAIDLKTARSTVESWLDLPQARILTPSPNHWRIILDLMESAQASGTVLSDAVLAGYAIENRAILYSNDADFSRFKRLKWVNPLATQS